MTREESFERMLTDIRANYNSIVEKMEKLRAEGKTKTVTYRELFGNKLTFETMLSMYKAYGLID